MPATLHFSGWNIIFSEIKSFRLYFKRHAYQGYRIAYTKLFNQKQLIPSYDSPNFVTFEVNIVGLTAKTCGISEK